MTTRAKVGLGVLGVGLLTALVALFAAGKLFFMSPTRFFCRWVWTVGGLTILGLLLYHHRQAINAAYSALPPITINIPRRPIIAKDEPFQLPNPEKCYWVNSRELAAFIGEARGDCQGFNEKSDEHWFLTRVDLTVFNVKTNENHVIITRRS